MNILLVVFSENYLQKIMLPLWYVRITVKERGAGALRTSGTSKIEKQNVAKSYIL